MISLGEAAALMEVDESTVVAWVRTGRRCIGILGRTMALPRWQFDPLVWPAIQVVGKERGTTDGWQVLSFMESPAPALNGLTPRLALEQGIHQAHCWRGDGRGALNMTPSSRRLGGHAAEPADGFCLTDVR